MTLPAIPASLRAHWRTHPADPLAWFSALYVAAQDTEPFDPARCALATADAEGRPSVRFVLVKGAIAGAFSFFTCFESQKARELDRNPRACLVWHWSTLGHQVRAEGAVARLDHASADAYFRARPRGSQLGAWASRQSSPVASREALDDALSLVTERFAGQDVPRPPNWGGYVLRPDRLEFWRDGADRLHDRVEYVRAGDRWAIQRLFP